MKVMVINDQGSTTIMMVIVQWKTVIIIKIKMARNKPTKPWFLFKEWALSSKSILPKEWWAAIKMLVKPNKRFASSGSKATVRKRTNATSCMKRLRRSCPFVSFSKKRGNATRETSAFIDTFYRVRWETTKILRIIISTQNRVSTTLNFRATSFVLTTIEAFATKENNANLVIDTPFKWWLKIITINNCV